MASPDPVLWMQQAVSELASKLSASPLFMSPNAQAAPVGSTGTILRVDQFDLWVPIVPDNTSVFCGIFYQGHSPAHDDWSVGQEDLDLDLDVQIAGQGRLAKTHQGRPERTQLWQLCTQAAGALPKICATEVGPGGSQFDGFCQRAYPLRSSTHETYDQGSDFYLLTVSVIVRMHITLTIP